MRLRKDFLDLQDIKARARKMLLLKKTSHIFTSDGMMNSWTWSMELRANFLLEEKSTMRSTC